MDDNAAGYAALDDLLEKMRRVEDIEQSDTEACADALRAKTASNIAAQIDPYGHAWPPTKDGYPALVNAMNAIKIVAEKTTIKFSVDGPEARHHIGNARGYHGGSYKQVGKHAQAWQAAKVAAGVPMVNTGYRRALIPFSQLPGPFKAIIRKVLIERFNRIFKEAA